LFSKELLKTLVKFLYLGTVFLGELKGPKITSLERAAWFYYQICQEAWKPHYGLIKN